MIKFIISVFLIFFTVLTTSLFAADRYASRGIFEYGGTISSSGYFFKNSEFVQSQTNINIVPILNYFILDNINIGLAPTFGYSYYKFNDSNYSNNHLISFGPQFSFGYTYQITEILYFDISPIIQYAYSKSFNDDLSTNYEVESFLYGFTISLKFNIGNTLLNIKLLQGYRNYISTVYSSTSDYYLSNLSLGISSFF